MKKKSKCQKCSIEFTWYSNVNRLNAKYCSIKCRGHTGFKAGFQKYRISLLSEEEKLHKLKESYEKNIIKKPGCWDWSGSKRKFGYGALSTNKYGCSDAHRASWIIHKGKIPKGLQVCHHCDNPICSNPSHLFLGTIRENCLDKIKKGRANFTIPPISYGERNKQSKLKEEDVKEIKKMLLNCIPSTYISELYNVSVSTISRIHLKKTWQHIKE